MTRIVLSGSWHSASSMTYELPASVSYDEELFKQKIDSLKCLQDNVEPEDAYIRELEDGFEVVPEIEGTKIDYEKLTEDISDAVKTGAYGCRSGRRWLLYQPDRICIGSD